MVDKKKKTIVVCLDSFKPAYLKDAGFLSCLAGQHSYSELETVLGYTAIGATVLTGKMPEEHGVWTEFKYSPQTSPFKILKYFRWTDNSFLELTTRFLFNVIFNFVRFFRGKSYLATIKNIPLSVIDSFDLSLEHSWGLRGKNSFFAELDRQKVSYCYFDWPVNATNKKISLDFFTRNNDKSKVKNFLRNIDKADFMWLRIWDLDSVAHKYGTGSSEVVECVKKTDKLCQEIINKAREKYDINFLFWSDHGMVDVKTFFDAYDLVKDLPVKMFINSTMVHFWADNENTKTELVKRLSSVAYGKVLIETDREKYKIRFTDNCYGDVIFLANPRVLIFPNYYQKKHPPKAMHGYAPEHPDQKGVFISSVGISKKERHIREIYDEILSFI